MWGRIVLVLVLGACDSGTESGASERKTLKDVELKDIDDVKMLKLIEVELLGLDIDEVRETDPLQYDGREHERDRRDRELRSRALRRAELEAEKRAIMRRLILRDAGIGRMTIDSLDDAGVDAGYLNL